MPGRRPAGGEPGDLVVGEGAAAPGPRVAGDHDGLTLGGQRAVLEADRLGRAHAGPSPAGDAALDRHLAGSLGDLAPVVDGHARQDEVVRLRPEELLEAPGRAPPRGS